MRIRTAGNDRSPRRGFEPFSGTSNSLGSGSNTTVKQGKLPLPSLAIDYKDKGKNAIGKEGKFEEKKLRERAERAELRATAYNNRCSAAATATTKSLTPLKPRLAR